MNIIEKRHYENTLEFEQYNKDFELIHEAYDLFFYKLGNVHIMYNEKDGSVNQLHEKQFNAMVRGFELERRERVEKLTHYTECLQCRNELDCDFNDTHPFFY